MTLIKETVQIILEVKIETALPLHQAMLELEKELDFNIKSTKHVAIKEAFVHKVTK